MKESYWGYWLIILGVFVIVIMMLVSSLTTTNTQDYYLIKEVTEQSMVDAVDLAYYRQSGELRINAEKFYESFIRRFAENVALSNYHIDFYGVYEAPPKVSVKVVTKSATYNVGADSTSFDIVNKIDAILELDGFTTDQELSNNEEKPSNDYKGLGIPEDNRTSGYLGEGSNSGNNGNSGNNNSGNNNSGNSGGNNSGNSGGNSGINGGFDLLDRRRPNSMLIRGFVSYTMQDKYYICTDGRTELASKCLGTSVIREEYKMNEDYFVEEVIKDWQKRYGIKLTTSEKNAFIEEFRKTFKFY